MSAFVLHASVGAASFSFLNGLFTCSGSSDKLSWLSMLTKGSLAFKLSSHAKEVLLENGDGRRR